MTIVVEKYQIECFETKRDYNLWISDKDNKHIFPSTIYHGEFYSIPQNVKDEFKDNILVSIKRKCHIDAQYVIIHKKQ